MEATFTPQEVAEVLKVDVELVLSHIRAGRLQATNVGLGSIRPRWRITQESFITFLNARRAGGPKPARRKKAAATAAIEFFQ